MKRLLLFAACGAVLGWAASCTVKFDDGTMVFKCSVDGECAGGGYVCVNSTYCCKVEGDEIANGCDGRDNDCDGMVDEGVGSVEICDGMDNDCDKVVDDGFDLIQDPRNCGSCGRSCMSNQACMNAVCVFSGESSCSDGMDNDKDSLIDCVDPECNLLSCGGGCQCRALAKAEGNCDDTVDNDGDGASDCGDVDCEGAGCGGAGCTCANQMKKEIDCRDGMDNDGDSMSDCMDADCAGSLCQAAPSMFRCGGGMTCSCNDAGTVAETGVLCRDRVDNDCNGLVDCAETACDGLSCATDGGLGCVCAGGGSRETNCADRRDNDNDALTDCADALPDGGGDCPFNTACTYLNAGGMVRNGMCAADRTCK